MKSGYDNLGNIVILKFKDEKKAEKIKLAKKILRERKSITTVLEKAERVKGRLRTIKTRWLAGKKTKEALYKESGCIFKFDIEKCYFSPRISGERLEIAGKIKKEDKVLVLFSGAAPFPIVIAKHSKAGKIIAVELGKECCKYARENVKLNKIHNVEIIQGDVKKLDKLLKIEKFDKIVMARPQLKDSFLEYVWKFIRKGGEIYYYDFGKDAEKIIEKVENEARKAGKRIRIMGWKKAGEIAPYKYRFRVDIKVN